VTLPTKPNANYHLTNYDGYYFDWRQTWSHNNANEIPSYHMYFRMQSFQFVSSLSRSWKIQRLLQRCDLIFVFECTLFLYLNIV
jgi:hypothetical protein